MYHYLARISKKLLPDWLYERLIGDWDKQGLKKYLQNTSWLAVAKIVSLVASFITIAIVARYLGPENYGKLSYAQSFVALISVLASLGIDQILYRDLVAHPEKEAEILGTAFFSKLFLGLFTIIVAYILVLTLNLEPVLSLLILIITCSFIVQPFGVIANVFAARVKSKYTAYIAIFVALLIPLIKLSVVWLGGGILFFASVLVVETAIYSIGSLLIYVTIFKEDIFSWKFSITRLKNMLWRSFPLALASLSGYIYGRIDQVMILHYIDSGAVGLYDIAVRLTEYLGYLPGLIIASLFPAIMNSRSSSASEYTHRWRSLIILCLSITTISALIITLFAKPIIGLLFGESFIASVKILQIYVWSILGSISIVLIQQYLIVENKMRIFLYFSFAGASINVVLNSLLIPKYGIYGAAFATIITMITIIVGFLFFKRIQDK